MGLNDGVTLLDRCLDAVYDAPVVQGGWPRALAQLALTFNASFVDICSWTHDRQHVSGLAHGLDEDDYKDNLLGFWFNRNVWSQKRPVTTAGEVLSTRQIIAREDLCISEMYHAYLKPRALHEGLRMSLWVDEQGLADVSLLRPWSQGAFGPGDVELGRALLPHVQRAAVLTRRLQEAEFQLDADVTRANFSKVAAIAFDAYGAPFWLNGNAHAMVERGHPLQMTGFHLTGLTSDATDRLRTALAQALSRSGSPRRASTVRLPMPDGRADVVAVVQPLSGRNDWILPRAPCAVVLVRDPGAGTPRLAVLQQVYGLTKAEAQTALDLLNGLTLGEAALRKGVSRNTLRTHLARLMEKTGTTRQVDLIRLLKDIEASQP